ncbi:MAG: serine/threonine protein kinase [Sphingomonadales bacterium]|nr:serine/threonine protein kinase [Sphingomonadales bacterium]MDE2168224.1 serine/threonine protein kinase [Sphingomonadales bacterium]
MKSFSRIASGIEGLDRILEGGFIRGASYIVQGRPGAGKTILSNQFAFNHAKAGGRVLFVTLLAESHERLFQALSTMDFFDAERLGKDISYVSVFQTLREEGLDAVVKLLRKETKRQEATLLIFDGLLNARDRADTDFDVKTFVAEVQGQAAFVDCTVLFLTSASLEETSPEHTMVDGVIELSDTLAGVRSLRQMQVRKSRGSRALGGLHKFEISNSGLTVYPRIETLYAHLGQQEEVEPTRISCGIGRLDTMMGGGLPRGSITLIAGPSGSGKTTLGLHFLATAENEPALHFGFFETEQRLRLKATSQGIALPPPGDPGFAVLWHPVAENLLDRLAHELLDHVAAHGIKRLFIDGLGGFERAAVHRDHLTEFFATLTAQLRNLGVTTVATWEIRDMVGGDISAPSAHLSALLDNMILLRQFEENHDLQRSLSIQKMRESAFDTHAYRLGFSPSGFMIGERLGHPLEQPSPSESRG